MANESGSPLVPEIVEDYDSGMAVIKAQSSAAIEVAVRTANQYPRSIKQFRADVLDMATVDEETAAECFYTKPVGNGSTAEGPSVRLAEIILATYGHIMVEARIIDEDRKKGVITAQGKAWDMQKNSWSTAEVSKSIKKRDGRLYSDPQIEVAKSALCSIAKRNAILGVVPKALVKKQMDEIRKVARGDEKTLGTRMSAMLEFFKKQGIKPAEICQFCNKSDSTELDADDLVRLKGLVNSVKDGDYPGYKEAFKDMGVETGDKDPFAPGKHRPEKDKKPDILQVDTTEGIPEDIFDGQEPDDPYADCDKSKVPYIKRIVAVNPESIIADLNQMTVRELRDLAKQVEEAAQTPKEQAEKPVEAQVIKKETADTTEDEDEDSAEKERILQDYKGKAATWGMTKGDLRKVFRSHPYFQEMSSDTIESYIAHPDDMDIEDLDCALTAIVDWQQGLNG